MNEIHATSSNSGKERGQDLIEIWDRNWSMNKQRLFVDDLSIFPAYDVLNRLKMGWKLRTKLYSHIPAGSTYDRDAANYIEESRRETLFGLKDFLKPGIHILSRLWVWKCCFRFGS